MSFDLDVANAMNYRNLVNGESVNITDRKPMGNASMELPSIAEKDWFDWLASIGND